MRSIAAAAAAAAAAVLLAGCVERTITITSEPSGALVWLNDREIGRTPVDVGFVHYGIYDVRLECSGCEPLWASGEARPPLWDRPGLDLVAELLPGRRAVKIAWHYQLEPVRDELEPLLHRAAELHRADAPPAAGP